MCPEDLVLAFAVNRVETLAGLSYNWTMPHTHSEVGAPAPGWATCKATIDNARLCIGVRVKSFDYCLAHLQRADLNQILAEFRPGADLDVRGTSINDELLALVLDAVRDSDGCPVFGHVSFVRAHFAGPAVFAKSVFSGTVNFNNAQFANYSDFRAAHFHKHAWFSGVRFGESALFSGTEFDDTAMFSAQFDANSEFEKVKFNGDAWFSAAQFIRTINFEYAEFYGQTGFDRAQFKSGANFIHTQFRRVASFPWAKFDDNADFRDAHFGGFADFRFARFDSVNLRGARFSEHIDFRGAQASNHMTFIGSSFQNATQVGPLAAGTLNLSEAVFNKRVRIEVAAVNVLCQGTTWSAGTTLQLRYARTDLERAAFASPSSVAGSDQSFKYVDDEQVCSQIDTRLQASSDIWIPKITSLHEADTGNLSVADVDLSECVFSGARLLYKIRLEGRCIFDHPPGGLRIGSAWPPLWRWSSRQLLAEERRWRATSRKYAGWSHVQSDKRDVIHPERLAGIYRQLRHSLEDSKNEPGSADFYYGEMDMRRLSSRRIEKWLLTGYWFLSGYGLRATRALVSLIILLCISTTVFATVGFTGSQTTEYLPYSTPSPLHTFVYKPVVVHGPMPGLASAVNYSVDSATSLLRPPQLQQPLTESGEAMEVVLRLLGPLLLGLGVLAMRNRVKR